MNRLVAWWDAPAAGPENMAADELLVAEAVAAGRVLVRLYAWSEPTVSLGGFQRLADAEGSDAIAGLPLVRRPSGGGGIIHGSDLTYAVAVPRDHAWGGEPQRLYDAFHEALAGLLCDRGVDASLHPGRDRAAGDEDRLLCFDRRARGDVVVAAAATSDATRARPDGLRAGPDGFKLLGSAQRRLRGGVLQHGSLLLRSPSVAAAARHPGLAELAPQAAAWDHRELATAWLARVAAVAGTPLEMRSESFLLGMAGEAADFAERAARFRDPAWLARR